MSAVFLRDWRLKFRDGIEWRPYYTAAKAYKFANESSLNPHAYHLTHILVLFLHIQVSMLQAASSVPVFPPKFHTTFLPLPCLHIARRFS